MLHRARTFKDEVEQHQTFFFKVYIHSKQTLVKIMIINGTTIIITLICIGIVGYIGLQLIRQFAFSIALENHESNIALDVKEDQQRQKKIEMADKAVSDAFKRVEPLISKNSNNPVEERVNIV